MTYNSYFASTTAISNIVANEMRKISKNTSSWSTEVTTGQREISNLTSSEIIISSSDSSQQTLHSSIYSGMQDAQKILLNGSSAIQEQQSIMSDILAFLNNLTPSFFTNSNIIELNSRLQSSLQQLQKVVSTTHDSNGKNILSSSPASGEYSISQIQNAFVQSNFNAATVANVNTQLVNSLSATAPAETISALNAAAATVATSTDTVAEYLCYAASAIFKTSTPANLIALQEVQDAIKAQQLIAVIPQFLLDCGLYVGSGLAADTSISSVIAGTFPGALIGPGNIQKQASFLNPTPSMLLFLNLFATDPSYLPYAVAMIQSVAGQALDINSNAESITTQQICMIFSYIPFFNNINLGQTQNAPK